MTTKIVLVMAHRADSFPNSCPELQSGVFKLFRTIQLVGPPKLKSMVILTEYNDSFLRISYSFFSHERHEAFLKARGLLIP